MDENTKKEIRWIFIFLAVFSFSIGIWENYKSVWLEVNNVSLSNISYIISAGLFITCFISIGIMFVFKKFNMSILVKICLFLRVVAMLVMALTFGRNIEWLKIVAFLVEAISTNLVIISIYPFITQKLKSGQIYSHRKLIEYLFTDLGILLAGGIIAFKLADFFEYNVLAIVSLALTVASIPFAFKFKSDNSEKQINLKLIFKDKINNLYLLYYFIQYIAYNTALGMLALLLKNLLGLSINFVSIFIIVASISGDLFGYLALYKLKFKNDYVNYACKFVLRLVLYALIAITGNVYVAIVGIFISLLVSRSWENVSDGVYINRIDKENQLAYANIRYGIGKCGMAIGVLISGALFPYGIQAVFGASCAIMVLSISLAFYLIYLRKKEEKAKNQLNEENVEISETKPQLQEGNAEMNETKPQLQDEKFEAQEEKIQAQEEKK